MPLLIITAVSIDQYLTDSINYKSYDSIGQYFTDSINSKSYDSIDQYFTDSINYNSYDSMDHYYTDPIKKKRTDSIHQAKYLSDSTVRRAWLTPSKLFSQV